MYELLTQFRLATADVTQSQVAMVTKADVTQNHVARATKDKRISLKGLKLYEPSTPSIVGIT